MKDWIFGLAFFGALGLGFSPPAQAQNIFNLDVIEGIRLEYKPGFSFLDTSTINPYLNAQGFTANSPIFINQGGGATLVLDRLMLGGEGLGYTGFKSSSAAGHTVQVEGSYGLFKLGYLLWKDQGFSFYPQIGLGSGTTYVTSSSPLNSILNLPQTEDIFQIQSSQLILDLSLGADYLIDFDALSDYRSGLSVGLRLGYLLIPSPPQWEARDRMIGGPNLPRLNAQGLYLNLSLGAAVFRE